MNWGKYVLVFFVVLILVVQMFAGDFISNGKSGETQNMISKRSGNEVSFDEKLLEYAGDNMVVFFILLVLYLDRKGVISLKKLFGNKQYNNINGRAKSNYGDNPHVTTDTYRGDQSAQWDKINWTITKIGYHQSEIDQINLKLDDLPEIKKIVTSMRDSTRDLVKAHNRIHPDDEVTKVK